MIPSTFRYHMLTGLLVAIAWMPVASGASSLVSYANVRPDATILVGSRHVRLYGIYIPPTRRNCRTNIRPAKCGSNAALALDFKIRGFVSCQLVQKHPDRSVTGYCQNRGVDLSAYLIERGWAVARPDGPFEYHVLERIARKRNMGMWGMYGIVVSSSTAAH